MFPICCHTISFQCSQLISTSHGCNVWTRWAANTLNIILNYRFARPQWHFKWFANTALKHWNGSSFVRIDNITRVISWMNAVVVAPTNNNSPRILWCVKIMNALRWWDKSNCSWCKWDFVFRRDFPEFLWNNSSNEINSNENRDFSKDRRNVLFKTIRVLSEIRTCIYVL